MERYENVDEQMWQEKRIGAPQLSVVLSPAGAGLTMPIMSKARPDHKTLALAVERRVLKGPGDTPAEQRVAVAARAAGEAREPGPFDELARQIGIAAYRVTDQQVASAVNAAGSERAAFEIIAAASLGAGLLRWREGLRVLGEASDAAA